MCDWFRLQYPTWHVWGAIIICNSRVFGDQNGQIWINNLRTQAKLKGAEMVIIAATTEFFPRSPSLRRQGLKGIHFQIRLSFFEFIAIRPLTSQIFFYFFYCSWGCRRTLKQLRWTGFFLVEQKLNYFFSSVFSSFFSQVSFWNVSSNRSALFLRSSQPRIPNRTKQNKTRQDKTRQEKHKTPI